MLAGRLSDKMSSELGCCVYAITGLLFLEVAYEYRADSFARATQWRIQWAGLQPEDVELYTTYENSSYSKPNPAYYQDILARLNVKPEECLMVGNDVGEDMIAEQLGMKVFLMTDCMINKANADISFYPHGSFDDLKNFLNTL